MLSNIVFWLIWLFVFIPVLAWIFGLILPVEKKESLVPDEAGSITDTKLAVEPALEKTVTPASQ